MHKIIDNNSKQMNKLIINKTALKWKSNKAENNLYYYLDSIKMKYTTDFSIYAEKRMQNWTSQLI